MPNLERTTIWRGGITAPRLTIETRSCFTWVDQRDQTFNLRFYIASKGGGTTEVCVEIGRDDLPAIFKEVATEIPEAAGVLVEHCRADVASLKAEAENLASEIEELKEKNKKLEVKMSRLRAQRDQHRAGVKEIARVANSLAPKTQRRRA